MAFNGLQSDWRLERLADVFKVQLGKMLSGKARAGISPKPYLRNKNVQWGSIDTSEIVEMDFNDREMEKFRLLNGDLLMCEGGEPGRTAIWRDELTECYYQKAIHRLRPLDGRTLPEFFLYWFRFAFDITNLYGISGASSTIAHLPAAQLQSLSVPVPPMAEQRQIAQVLSAVQRAIERQERLIALTAELKRALMHKLFTEGIRSEPLKQTEIGSVPESWALERCDDLCEEISVGVVVRPRSYYVETGVPAFRSLNVREDRLETDDLVYFSKEVNDGTLYKSKLRAGDVLIVRTGYPGTSCVVPPEYDGSNCIDIVFARPGPRIMCGYLSRFFNSDSGKIQATAAKHGLAQQHLNVGAVKRVQVPLPTLEEQCAIVNALATVDAKRDVHMRAAQMFRVVFRTLLHQLMTAQVRIHDFDLTALNEPEVELAGVT